MGNARRTLYPIQSEPGHFQTGLLPDGTQAFLSTDYTRLLAVLFDADGRFLQVLTRKCSAEAGSDDFLVLWWEELHEWEEEMGISPSVIRLRKFDLPEIRFGIRDLPAIYQEALDGEEAPDEDTQESIKEWRESGLYVLVWGDEIDVGPDGEVVST